MTRRAPPVALLALAHAAGALPVHLGVTPRPALLLPALLLLPIPLWRRPVPGHRLCRLALLAAALAGTLGAWSHVEADRRDCRRALRDGARISVIGRLPAPPLDGRGVLAIQQGLGAGCTGEV